MSASSFGRLQRVVVCRQIGGDDIVPASAQLSLDPMPIPADVTSRGSIRTCSIVFAPIAAIRPREQNARALLTAFVAARTLV